MEERRARADSAGDPARDRERRAGSRARSLWEKWWRFILVVMKVFYGAVDEFATAEYRPLSLVKSS